ncbi:MAG: alpha/beta hydrolase [Verrucomicrobia bacterium]|nr:alpha/beta hydrolase [Verrucomicrobiota bacterium]
MKRSPLLLSGLILLAAACRLTAAEGHSLIPEPTVANLAYGRDPKQTLDFWRAQSAAPTPVVIFIHGGGFTIGDKAEARRDPTVKACLDAGVSVVSINYRYLAPGVTLLDILHDTARALQQVRAKAAEWRVDPTRVAAFGESAGASLSLWLAFHDDLAEPSSADPVARQSTRLTCAGAKNPQCSFDPLRWEAVFGTEVVERLGGIYKSPEHLGCATREELRAPAGALARAECDFLGLISPDDPPVFLDASGRGMALQTLGQLLHHPRHAQLLHVRCRDVGVADVAVIPAYDVAPSGREPVTLREFLLRNLAVRLPAEVGSVR